MNYKNKYIKYKTKYLELNNINLIGGAKKKCYIDDTDIVLFGEGGSTSIIVITKDKRVYKIFTLYNYILDINLDKQIRDNNKRVNNEIKIYELLTKNIIDKDISKHIVRYINSNKCNNAKTLFKKCPNSYVEFIKLDQDQKTKMCDQLFRNHPHKKLYNEYKVI